MYFLSMIRLLITCYIRSPLIDPIIKMQLYKSELLYLLPSISKSGKYDLKRTRLATIFINSGLSCLIEYVINPIIPITKTHYTIRRQINEV